MPDLPAKRKGPLRFAVVFREDCTQKKTAGAKAPAVCNDNSGFAFVTRFSLITRQQSWTRYQIKNGLFLTIEMFAIFFLHFFCYPCAPKGMPVPLTCFSDLQFHAALPEYRQVLYLP